MSRRIMEEHTVGEMLGYGGLEQIRRYLGAVSLHGGYTRSDATSSGDLALELKQFVHRKEIALTILEAIQHKTTLRRGMVDPLMD